MTPSIKQQAPRGRRRSPIVLTLVVLTACAAAGAWWLGRTPAFVVEPDTTQNVLLVTIDTLRADALSSYGGPARTPNLDRLAAGGARFTFAHSHTVVTLPSHTSILSGLLPYEHGMRDNSGFRVRPGTPTLATRLKARGFATGRLRRRVPADQALRAHARLRRLRRPDARDVAERSTIVDARAPRGRRRSSRASTGSGSRRALLRAGSTSSTRTPPTSRPPDLASAYAAAAVLRRGRVRRRALGPLFERLATLSAPDARHRHRGPWREPWRARRADARHVRLRGDAARAADRRARRARAARRAAASSSTRRSATSTSSPTVLDAVGADADPRAARRVAARRDRRRARRADRPAYFESMTYNLVRGWAPLRGVLVGRAASTSTFRSPSSTTWPPIPKRRQTWRPAQRDQLQVLTNLLRTYNVAPPQSARPGIRGGRRRAPNRSAMFRAARPPRRPTPKPTIPSGWSSIDRDLHTATDV